MKISIGRIAEVSLLVSFLFVCVVGLSACDLFNQTQDDPQGEENPDFEITLTEGTYSNAVRISWNAMENEELYRYTVWASDSSDGTGEYRYKKTNLTEAYFFTEPGADPKYFCVKANDEDDKILFRTEWKSGYADEAGTVKDLPPITGLSASKGEYPDSILLQYDESPEAHEYQITQTTTLDVLPGHEVYLSDQTEVSLETTDSCLFYFIVRAYTNPVGATDDTRRYSDDGEIVSGYISGGGEEALQPPTGITVTPADGNGDSVVSWSAATGADAYRIYLSASPEINYTRDQSSTGMVYTTSTTINIDDGEQRYLKLMSVETREGGSRHLFSDLSGWYRLSDGADYSQGITVDVPEIPTEFDVTPWMTSLECDWEPVAGAVRYRIFENEVLDLWTLIGTAEEPPYTITGVLPETEYVLKVRAYTDEAAGDFTEPLTVTTLPLGEVGPPTDVTATASATARAAIIDWTEVDGALDYGLYRSDDGENFELITHIQPGAELLDGSHGYLDADNELAAGTTYSYYMTTYDTEGNESEPGDTVTVTIGDN